MQRVERLIHFCRMKSHGLNQYQARINVFCARTQRSDAGEARDGNPSVSTLYHCLAASNVFISVALEFKW